MVVFKRIHQVKQSKHVSAAAGITRLQAISNPSRLEIIALIEDREFTAGDIASQLEKSQPLTAYHLGILVATGLLLRRRVGRYRYYRLASVDVSILATAISRLVGENYDPIIS